MTDEDLKKLVDLANERGAIHAISTIHPDTLKDLLIELQGRRKADALRTISYDDNRVPKEARDGDFMMIDGWPTMITGAPEYRSPDLISELLERSAGPRMHAPDID